MKNTHLSHHRIIFLVAFLCAGIMASLFVYRTSHRDTPLTLANGSITLFSVPREIKDMSLVTHTNQPFTRRSLQGHWSILFFGFTHCSTVCPATLSKLQMAYPALHAIDPTLQLIFISLDPERDSPNTLSQFLSTYHTNLVGVTGKIQQIRKLQSQLGIYAERAPSTDQIQHTPSLILINPDARFAGIIASDITPAALIDAWPHHT